MNELNDLKTKKSFIDWSIDSKKKSTIDCRCNKFIDWLIFKIHKINNWLLFSQIHDHFRWFTMRIMKIKCNHRFQKKNSNWRFFLIHVFLRMIRRFFLIRVFLQTIKTLFLFVFFYEQITIFFNFAYFYERLTILFCLFAYFDEQFVSTKRLTNIN